jgi:pimeloyl-ACP methyl ester carboxylesterase
MRARGAALAERGWNVVLIDNRARGQSEGAFCTFGTLDAEDMQCWLDALGERIGPGFAPVLWGRSMGAAIAMRAASLDARIAALVLEAPYSDLSLSVAAGLRRKHLPGWLARPMLRRASRLAGVALQRPSPADLASELRLPTLVLLGLDDVISPPDDVRRLAAAFPNTPVIVEVPGARHNDIFEIGGEPLVRDVCEFLDKGVAGEPRFSAAGSGSPT